MKKYPCPFCGYTRPDTTTFPTGGTYFVFCMSCGARGPYKTEPESSEEAWNNRNNGEIKDE